MSPAKQDATLFPSLGSATYTEVWSRLDEVAVVDQAPSVSQTHDQLSISDREFEKCLEAFKATLATAQAGHRELGDVFVQHLPSAPSLWRYYAAVLEHLGQLGHDRKPFLARLLHSNGDLLRKTNAFEGASDCAKFMEQLGSVSELQKVRDNILDIIAQMVLQAKNSTTEAHDVVILRLIEHTGRNMSLKGRHRLLSAVLKRSYALASKLRQSPDKQLLLAHLAHPNRAQDVISSTVRSIAQASCDIATAERALFYMPHQHLLWLISRVTPRLANLRTSRRESTGSTMRKSRSDVAQNLDVWLQLLHRVDTKAKTNGAFLHAATASLARALGTVWSKKHAARVQQEYLIKALLLRLGIDADIPLTMNEPRQFHVLFGDVLLQLRTQPTDHTALLDLALPLITEHAGSIGLLRCLQTMEELGLPLSTHVDFDSLVANEIAMLQDSTAALSQKQLQNRALIMQSCEKLLNTLDRMGHTLQARMVEVAALSGNRQFTNVLLHAKTTSALPLAFRDASTSLSLLDRVGLVHQLAVHYSQDTTRTQRATWRSIYYLYTYMKAHSLPVGPLFTKAVVQASITRPQAENQFVSARRLIWVCHLVARVEGDAAAARVEDQYWKWRGRLIGQSKRIYVGVGGNKHSKAHVGTLKRLRLI